MATLDLDRTFVHDDFTSVSIASLLEQHEGHIEQLFLPEHCAVRGACSTVSDLVRQSGFYLLARYCVPSPWPLPPSHNHCVE